MYRVKKRERENNKQSSSDGSPEVRLENRCIVLDELPIGEPNGNAKAGITTAD